MSHPGSLSDSQSRRFASLDICGIAPLLGQDTPSQNALNEATTPKPGTRPSSPPAPPFVMKQTNHVRRARA